MEVGKRVSDLTGYEGAGPTGMVDFPCDPNTLPTSAELPLGDLILEIKSVSVEKTKPNLSGEVNAKTGRPKVGEKMMVKVQYAVDEPEDYRGLPHTKNFILGSDEDPKAEKVATWQRNGTTLMQMFKAAKVGGKTFAEYSAAAVGQKVGASVKVEKSKDPQYSDKHTPRSFWEPGTRSVRVENPNADLDRAFSAGNSAPAASAYSNND